MSLGIAFKGAEGIVLAADSRVTLATQLQQPNQPPTRVSSTYDNATKLLRVNGHDHVGAVSYGVGAIGQTEPRTAHSYMPEMEKQLEGIGRLSVEDFADHLSQFFLDKWQAQNMPTVQGQDMIFLVAGYDEDAPYGRVFEVIIPNKPMPTELNAGSFGIAWGGQREYTDRLIQGFDPELPSVMQTFLGLPNQQRVEIENHLKSRFNAPIPYQFLPLQDCVDMSIFLIRTTITIQNWIVGIRGVGGAIDVATITKTEGFKPVQLKAITGERGGTLS